MNENIICPKCGSKDTVANMTVLVVAPSSYYQNLKKRDFTKRDVRINGLSGGLHANYISCLDCGWSSIGNEVEL